MKSSLPKIDDSTKRRWRSGFNRRRRGAIEFGQQADANIEKLLIRRFDRLVSVRRFVLLVLVGIGQLRSLSGYYQTLKPVPGGLYNEGVIGSFTTANPLYATGAADTAVAAASRRPASGIEGLM